MKDFPGSVSVSLIWLVSFAQEIPIVGYDTWFKLEPRSSTSKVQGECHLILKLFTSQVCGFNLHHTSPPLVCVELLLILSFFLQRDTTLSQKDSNVSIHKKLLSQIVEYEHAHVKVSIIRYLL